MLVSSSSCHPPPHLFRDAAPYDITSPRSGRVYGPRTMRLAGEGAEGQPGAFNGNLLVTVSVEEDPYFQRDGADVHTECKISVATAILGGREDVRTLGGTVEMKVLKATQPDSRLSMKGKEITRLNGGGKGNHIVHLKVEIPKSISKRQEELLEEFEEEGKIYSEGVREKFKKATKKATGSLFDFFTSSDDDDNDDKSKDKKSEKKKGDEKTKGKTGKSKGEDGNDKDKVTPPRSASA